MKLLDPELYVTRILFRQALYNIVAIENLVALSIEEVKIKVFL